MLLAEYKKAYKLFNNKIELKMYVFLIHILSIHTYTINAISNKI